MSFSERFTDNSFDDPEMITPEMKTDNSFSNMSGQDLANHLEVKQYGPFVLTDAVRPALDLKIKPTQGYRHDVYVDEESGATVPVIMASASREILFGLFMDLVAKLGPVVDVVLETSHDSTTGSHTDMYREHIDAPVLTSNLWAYENLLTNDGCTGIAVLNPRTPQEVQFDEHKLLIIYGSPLEQFEYVLESRGVPCKPQMQFITEAEHVHSSTEAFEFEFNQLRTDLGLDGASFEADADSDNGFQV